MIARSQIHRKIRIELGCAIMTVENENKVCERHKKSRMELACAEMTVKGENKIFGRDRRGGWSWGAQI